MERGIVGPGAKNGKLRSAGKRRVGIGGKIHGANLPRDAPGFNPKRGPRVSKPEGRRPGAREDGSPPATARITASGSGPDG